MNEFLSGRSFSFVPEAEVQSLVERGTFDPVCLANELDKVSRLPEHGSHVCFREESDSFAGSLGAFDERLGLRDATLNLAGLRSSEGWIHAGADGGDQAVEFGFKALHLKAGAGNLGSLGVAFSVGGDDGCDGRVKMVGTRDCEQPLVNDSENPLLAN